MKNKDRKIRVKFSFENGSVQIINMSYEAQSVLGDIAHDLRAVSFEILK